MTEKNRLFIAVIGAGKCSRKLRDQAEAIGRGIAEHRAVLVCGGRGGVMEAAARGARAAGGLTIGILPGNDRSDANDYIDIVIPTGIGEARNMIVIRTADVVIALPGKFGTLSEMAFSMKMNKPVVSLSAWDISDKIARVDNPEEAVAAALRLAEN